MHSLLITYDLVGTAETSEDYKHLIDHIQTHSYWCKVALSTWVVRTERTAVQVRDSCFAHMDSNDRLFVGVLTGAAAWQNVICTDAQLKTGLGF